MKLISLDVENITSLKGKHSINFASLCHHSDIFAITGPTGSGKSSLLTAISLALYGRTVKSNLAAQDYVTVGTPHAHIELEFNLGRVHYKAVWHCQLLKKNGEFRSKPKVLRLLTDLNSGQERLIEDLIDLNFSQFNKVAILNQGKFSDFLHASFTERKELLETILNDQTFLLLGRTLKNNILSIEQNIDKMTAQSDHSQLLDTEDKKELTGQLNQLEKDLPINTDFLESFTQISLLISKMIDHGKQEVKIEQKVQQYIKEVAQALNLLTAHKEKEEQARLLKQKATATLTKEKPRLEEALALKQKTHHLTQQVIHLRQALDKSQQQINEQQDLLHLDKEELLKKKKQFDNLSPTTLTLSQEERQDYIDSFDDYLVTRQKSQEMSRRKDELNSSLEQSKQLAHKSLQILAEKRPSFITEIATPLDIQNILRKDQQKKDEIQLQIKELEKQEYDYQQISQRIHKNRQELTGLQKQRERDLVSLQHDEKEYLPLSELYQQNQQLKHKLEHFQAILHQEHSTNCPICEQEVPQAKKQEIKKLIMSIDDHKLNSTEKRVNHLQASISKNQQSLSIVAKQIEQKNKDISSEEKRLKILGDIIQKSNIVSIDLINDKIKQSEQYLYARQAYTEQQQQQKQSDHDIILKLQSLNRQQVSIHRIIKNLFSKLTRYSSQLKNMTEDHELINYLKIMKEEHARIMSLRQSEAELQVRIKRTEKQIQHLNEQLENHNSEFKDIHDQLESIQKLYRDKNYPTDPKKILDQFLGTCDSSERHYQQRHHEYRNQELSYQKLQSILRTLNEQQDDAKIVFLHYKAQIVPLLGQLPQKLSSMTLGGPTLDQSAIKKVCLWLDNSDQERSRSLTALESLHRDTLVPWLTMANECLLKQQRQKIIVATRLEENQKQEDKIAKLLKQSKSLKKQLTKLHELEFYIGKDKFRDYALSVLEKALLDLANYEIGQLADGRYKIIHAKEGKRSEFLIQDEWIGRSQRKVSTLSGGETFMLSLGLALALSKLNSGGQEIGFFLIDEGFGSLDEESIEEVLECLMNLRSRGKQIGIISHVKSLTSRIPATIELDKNHFGESQISVTH